MAVNAIVYLAESFSATPSQVRATIFESELALADLGLNKDGSKYAVYDWTAAPKLGFSPTVTFTAKSTPSSILASVQIRVPVGTYPTAEALTDENPSIVEPLTVTLTVRGGANDYNATSLSALKAMIDICSGLILLDNTDGSYDASSPVLAKLLRGNANCW